MSPARHRRLSLGVAFAAVLAIAAPVAAAEPHVSVLVDGLDNPRGIDIGANGRVVVAETGAGRVIQVKANGSIATLADGFPVVVTPEGASGVHNVSLDGSGNLFMATGEAEPGNDDGFWTLSRQPGGGKLKTYSDILAYQATDPDPTDVDEPPNPTQSNPYGLQTVGASKALVTDAGNNDLLLLSNKTGIVTVARFPTEMVATDHLPFPFPAPQVPAEAVPTTVAIGPDGAWYVGELKGFPFRPGSSSIWRIEPWARGATCDDDASDGCSRWATGFTAIVGMEFAPDGSLYVGEMVATGLFSFFAGGQTMGALWHVEGGSRTQVATGELHLIGDVAVDREGTVYVTTGSVTGDGAVVRIEP